MDTCKKCNSILPDKIKRYATYCNSCYDIGVMFWTENKNKQ